MVYHFLDLIVVHLWFVCLVEHLLVQVGHFFQHLQYQLYRLLKKVLHLLFHCLLAEGLIHLLEDWVRQEEWCLNLLDKRYLQ